MWIRKRIGPRTLPWGTPEVTLMEEEVLPSRRTCCVHMATVLRRYRFSPS